MYGGKLSKINNQIWCNKLHVTAHIYLINWTKSHALDYEKSAVMYIFGNFVKFWYRFNLIQVKRNLICSMRKAWEKKKQARKLGEKTQLKAHFPLKKWIFSGNSGKKIKQKVSCLISVLFSFFQMYFPGTILPDNTK